jgi:hypothetical protein
MWFQPGQEGQRLHYVSLDVADDLSVSAGSHSVFGDAAISRARKLGFLNIPFTRRSSRRYPWQTDT